MRYAAILLALLLISVDGAAQRTSPKTAPRPNTAKPKAAPKPTPTPDPRGNETERFEKALAVEDAGERAGSIEKFIADFPSSTRLGEAREALMLAHLAKADSYIEAGNIELAARWYLDALKGSGDIWTDEVFDDRIRKIPSTLFFRGMRAEGYQAASEIRKQISKEPTRLLTLAGFYLSVEDGREAAELAELAIALRPENSSGFQILAMARRVNFDIEAAERAFAKALEFDPESVTAERGLADMKRASGKTAEAIEIYRRILAKNETDGAAQTGLILSLFENGEQKEAEKLLAAALGQNPRNLQLLAGAAYWYASAGNGERSTELAGKAIDLEPRYIWSHISMARGLLLQRRPVDAERVLIAARQYGNFPTLEFEIANARYAAGFFREAAEELEKSFVFENGSVRVKLGGRLERSGDDILQLIAAERRASILSFVGPDDREPAKRLAALTEFLAAARSPGPDAERAILAADRFVEGTDPMGVHRKLFAASVLLEKQVAIKFVIELAGSATGTTDAGLQVSDPAAAVMASELYEPRQAAIRKNQFLMVPEVPRQTLSAVLRGRVEDLIGRASLTLGDTETAVLRLRRAVSVLPEKSKWWRVSKWQLGNALSAEGKDPEALENYLQSYNPAEPDVIKYAVVESLYRKVNSGIDGLEARIGPSPLPPAAEPVQTIDIEKKTEQQAAAAQNATENLAESKPDKAEKPSNDPNVASDPKPVEPSEKRTADGPPSEEKRSDQPVEKDREASQKKTDGEVPQPTEPRSDPGTEKITVDEKAEKPPADKAGDKEAAKIETATEATVAARNERPAGDAAKAEGEVPKKQDRPVFEPVVITVDPTRKTTDPLKDNEARDHEASDDSIKIAAEKRADRAPADAADDDRAREKKEVEPEIPQTSEKDDNVPPARPRIVAGVEVKSDVIPCTLELSQPNVSILSDGGSVGVLLSFDAELNGVFAQSSSPEDLEVRHHPEVAGVEGKAYYVVRSVSKRTGLFRVMFLAPCGRAEMRVSVR